MQGGIIEEGKGTGVEEEEVAAEEVVVVEEEVVVEWEERGGEEEGGGIPNARSDDFIPAVFDDLA